MWKELVGDIWVDQECLVRTSSGLSFLSSLTVFDPVETPGFLAEDLPTICLPNGMALNDLLNTFSVPFMIKMEDLSLFIISVVYGLFLFPVLQI